MRDAVSMCAGLAPIPARGHADQLSEGVREVIAVVETRGERDVGDVVVALAQRRHGAGQAQLHQIVVRRRRRRLAEYATQIASRVAKPMGELVEIDGLSAV